MRSPDLKGTVPSLAMLVPSKASRMSPVPNTWLIGAVGSTRRTRTPFWPACAAGQAEHVRVWAQGRLGSGSHGSQAQYERQPWHLQRHGVNRAGMAHGDQQGTWSEALSTSRAADP